MVSINVNPSPQNSPTKEADGSDSFTRTGSIGFTGPRINIGSGSKGPSRSTIWLLFEVSLSQGTIFAGISLGLVRELTTGTTLLPVSIGFLEIDGTWETGGESGTGWFEYANIESLPHPNTASDAAWLNSSASLTHDINVNDHVDGDRVKWGFNTPGLNYVNSKFLTDFQTIFDKNEQFRTSRGVPIAMAIVPTATDPRVFDFTSIDSSVIKDRPELFVRSRRIHIG